MYGVELLVVLLAVVTIIVMARLRIDIGLSLLVAGLMVLLLLAPNEIIQVLYNTLLDNKTLFLLSASMSIAVFAEIYRLTGFIEQLGRNLSFRLGDPRYALVIVPAVIGLLPVAGGALMSAPIVGVLGSLLGLTPALNVYVNVWFRHTIFLSYPLGQSLIITSTISGVDLASLALRNLPVALFMAFIGYVLALRGKKIVRKQLLEGSGPKSLVTVISPLIIALASGIVLRTIMGDYGIVVGVILGLLSLIVLAKPKPYIVVGVFRNRRVLGIILAAYSIIFFQKTILYTSSEAIANAITSLGIPLLVIEAFLPFLLGYFLASPLTSIVISIPLIANITGSTLPLDSVSLVFVSAFLGYLISPAHLCLVYTLEYFKENISKVYRYFIPSTLLSLAFTIVYLLLT